MWEGLRVYGGRVFHLDKHLRRLRDSARAMDFKGRGLSFLSRLY